VRPDQRPRPGRSRARLLQGRPHLLTNARAQSRSQAASAACFLRLASSSSHPGYAATPCTDHSLRKGMAAEQAAFFLYPDDARAFVPHGEDISLQTNYEIHQKLTDEVHIALDPWDITPLSDEPERARAIGAVVLGGTARELDRCPDQVDRRRGLDRSTRAVGRSEDRVYINPYHRLLPDSAQLDRRYAATHRGRGRGGGTGWLAAWKGPSLCAVSRGGRLMLGHLHPWGRDTQLERDGRDRVRPVRKRGPSAAGRPLSRADPAVQRGRAGFVLVHARRGARTA
jgi:hypothetical protein